jgi:hypothetical protein
MQREKKKLLYGRIANHIVLAFLLFIGACLLYNIYTLFFPLRTVIEADGAEHLHAAYLLSIGERPYLDFIQNHPMLFEHFLVWAERFFGITSTRNLALVARVVIFGHFILCLVVFGLWTSRMVGKRPKGMAWVAMLFTAWAMLALYNPQFHFMWEIRPDFICYGQTLLGLYLIFLWIERLDITHNRGALIWAIVGGGLIGFGNAIIPKGIPFIAGFALTLVCAALLTSRAELINRMNRRNIIGLVYIGMAGALSFIAWMVIDCHLSRIPISKWVAAVFLLNSRKHFILSNAGTNPVTTLLELFAVSLPLALALSGWIVWELINFDKANLGKNKRVYLWLFSIYTVITNIILPTYSNGMTWSYYFAPSFFSAAAICLMLLLWLWQSYELHPFKKPFSISHGVMILIAAIIAIHAGSNATHSFKQPRIRRAEAKAIAKTGADDFAIETILPKDFIYFGPPDRIPIKSRNWGYYFMLERATGFWTDCYALGLGPDPRKVWRKGFGHNPPDAIAFAPFSEVSRFVYCVNEYQHINISWLFDEIRTNYVLLQTKGASLYIRKDRVPDLESKGWRALRKPRRRPTLTVGGASGGRSGSEPLVKAFSSKGTQSSLIIFLRKSMAAIKSLIGSNF